MKEGIIGQLKEYIHFEREIRSAENMDSLGFVACNYLKRFVSYDVAVFLIGRGGQEKVQTISGVSDFEVNSPLVKACELLCSQGDSPEDIVDVQYTSSMAPNISNCFESIGISQVTRVVLIGNDASLLVIRDEPWQSHEIQMLQDISDVLSHSIISLKRQKDISFSRRLVQSFRPGWKWFGVGILACSWLPVPQSIIASAEVKASQPMVVSSGLNGVVEEVLVRPNENVSKGQLLVRFDDTDLNHQRSTILTELSLAEEQLRKAHQNSLHASDERTAFAQLSAQIEIKKLELSHIEEAIDRLELKAHSDGVVLFNRVEDWLGRSVSTGERIMQIAAADDNQFEVWVATNDAIDFSEGQSMKFFPDAHPLQSVDGSIVSFGFLASMSDTDTLAYRVLADPGEGADHLRLGMKGTARLYGEKAPLVYQLLRKPISSIRKHAGV